MKSLMYVVAIVFGLPLGFALVTKLSETPAHNDAHDEAWRMEQARINALPWGTPESVRREREKQEREQKRFLDEQKRFQDGMKSLDLGTCDILVELTLGKPLRKQQMRSQFDTTEYWYYPENVQIGIVNGKVQSINKY